MLVGEAAAERAELLAEEKRVSKELKELVAREKNYVKEMTQKIENKTKLIERAKTVDEPNLIYSKKRLR